MYVTTVKLYGTHITNVYKSPEKEWRQPVLETLLHPSLYIGDFNSHHQDWSYQENDTNGELLTDWASQNELHLVFDAKDEKTFYSRAH